MHTPLALALALVSSSLATVPEPPQAGRPPNVLVILADELRRPALACYGNPLVDTPNIDRLAEDGLRFDRAYSNSPKCEPFRLALLTGRWHHLAGQTLDPDAAPTIAELMSPTHDCAWFGKAHWIPPSAETTGWVPPEYRVGWQRFLGFDRPIFLHLYTNSSYFDGENKTLKPLLGYQPTGQTSQVIRHIRKKVLSQRPFFVVLSFGPPHKPFVPPNKYNIYSPSQVALRPNVPASLAKYARADIAKYLGLVYSLDVEVGRLLDEIEKLGVRDETYVVFTSDHGSMLYSQGQLTKQRPYEESVGIPLILRGPGIEPGVSRRLVSSVDIMPTLLGLAGVPVPDTVQGRDVFASEDPDFAYLEMDILNGNSWMSLHWRGGIRADGVKYAVTEAGTGALYLPDDEYEQRNHFGDPQYAELQAAMHARCVEFAASTGDAFFSAE